MPPRDRHLHPVPKPQPDQHALAEALLALGARVGTLETKMSAVAKRSVCTIIAADVLLGLAKMGLEYFTAK